MNRRLAILTGAAALAAGLLLGWLLWRPSRSGFELPALVREIRAIEELATVKYRVQKVVGLEEAKPYLGAERILLIVQAEVAAGIDLKQLQAANLKWLGANRVLVKLPEPKILQVAIDDQNTKVWDRGITWWTPWVPYNKDLERQARLQAIESIGKEAVAMGILEQARRNAEASITRLLTALGLEAVTFGSWARSRATRPAWCRSGSRESRAGRRRRSRAGGRRC